MIRTGLKFSVLAGTFGAVNYQVMKIRRKSDPLNFTAGGLASGALGGLLQGMISTLMTLALSDHRLKEASRAWLEVGSVWVRLDLLLG